MYVCMNVSSLVGRCTLLSKMDVFMMRTLYIMFNNLYKKQIFNRFGVSIGGSILFKTKNVRARAPTFTRQRMRARVCMCVSVCPCVCISVCMCVCVLVQLSGSVFRSRCVSVDVSVSASPVCA